MEYYITEEEASAAAIVESGRLGSKEARGKIGKNRYEQINAMLFEQALGEQMALRELMSEYEKQEKINEKLFQIL